ncbi:hypothetical protein OFC63_35280, partial [Escherichia coli]|nr:hypothetical protein [Escherichia coli]
LLEPSGRPRAAVDAFEVEPHRTVPRVFVSAAQGEGLDELRHIIAQAALGQLELPVPAEPQTPAEDGEPAPACASADT